MAFGLFASFKSEGIVKDIPCTTISCLYHCGNRIYSMFNL